MGGCGACGRGSQCGRRIGVLHRCRACARRPTPGGLRSASVQTDPAGRRTSARVGPRASRAGCRVIDSELRDEMTTGIYVATGNEVQLFEHAYRHKIPVMLTGPTGCGKTRFVEHMGARLGRPVVTISCHDDLTSSDLVGRFMIKGGDVVWTDGPLTRAVKAGAICYLDEVVEARHDSLAILHSLTDHRRALYLDRSGEVVKAPDSFMLVCSYNPAYRSSLKELKPSFRQRFVTLPMHYLPPEREAEVIVAEAGVELTTATRLVRCAIAIRNADEVFHFEPP